VSPDGSLSKIWLFEQLPLKFRGQPPPGSGDFPPKDRLRLHEVLRLFYSGYGSDAIPDAVGGRAVTGSATADGLIHRYTHMFLGNPYLGQTQ
jgi:hypothetical protein